jgi:hypothetical protein
MLSAGTVGTWRRTDAFLELLNLSFDSRTDRIVSPGMHSRLLMPLIAEIEPAFELVRARKRSLAFML